MSDRLDDGPEETEVAGLMDELVGVIGQRMDFARVAHGHDFDQERRNIPAEETGLQIDIYKDPYLIEFLGLEPLPGDPTTEDVERDFGEGEG